MCCSILSHGLSALAEHPNINRGTYVPACVPATVWHTRGHATKPQPCVMNLVLYDFQTAMAEFCNFSYFVAPVLFVVWYISEISAV